MSLLSGVTILYPLVLAILLRLINCISNCFWLAMIFRFAIVPWSGCSSSRQLEILLEQILTSSSEHLTLHVTLLKHFLALRTQSVSIKCLRVKLISLTQRLASNRPKLNSVPSTTRSRLKSLKKSPFFWPFLILVPAHTAPPCRIMIVSILLPTVAFTILFVPCARPVRISNLVVPSPRNS
jgi:hypothetical protein